MVLSIPMAYCDSNRGQKTDTVNADVNALFCIVCMFCLQGFVCPICMQSYAKPEDLQRHFDSQHQEPHPGVPDKPNQVLTFIC